jgi:DNA-binding transcriptional ArsR family regulator
MAVKQITEIDDPRLVKAMAHPLRIHILRILQERVASPRELAEELGGSLPNISYHVQFLLRLDLLELVDTKQRRGAIEHYYRARSRLRVTGKAWAQVPDIVKNALVAATLDQISAYVEAGARIGGFDRKDAHASRQPLVLDSQGFKELGALLDETLDRARAIEAASTKRMAKADHAAEEISSGMVLMLFEAPLASVGLPRRRAHKTRDSPPRRSRAKK